MKRPFFVTPDTRRALTELAAFAEQEANWYRVGRDAWVPGDRPEYVRHLDTYRIVFTITVMPDGMRFRHLSMSVVGAPPGKYPHQIVVFTVATMLGFEGGKSGRDITIAPGPDWQFDASAVEHCTVLFAPL